MRSFKFYTICLILLTLIFTTPAAAYAARQTTVFQTLGSELDFFGTNINI